MILFFFLESWGSILCLRKAGEKHKSSSSIPKTQSLCVQEFEECLSDSMWVSSGLRLFIYSVWVSDFRIQFEYDVYYQIVYSVPLRNPP